MFFDLRPSPFDEPSLARAKAYLNSKSSEEVEALAIAAAQLDVAHRAYLEGATSKAEVRKKLVQCLSLLEGFEERTFEDLVREAQEDRFQWEFASGGPLGSDHSSTDLDPIFSLYETPEEGASSSAAKAQWRWSEKLLYLFPCHVEAEAVRLAGHDRELEDEFELPEGLPVVRRSSEPEPEAPSETVRPDLSPSLRIPSSLLRPELSQTEALETADEPLRRLLEEPSLQAPPPVSDDPLDLELDELLGDTARLPFDQTSKPSLGRMGNESKGDPLSRLLEDSPEESPQLSRASEESFDIDLPPPRDPLEHLLGSIPEPVAQTEPRVLEDSTANLPETDTEPRYQEEPSGEVEAEDPVEVDSVEIESGPEVPSTASLRSADPLENLLFESPEEFLTASPEPQLSESLEEAADLPQESLEHFALGEEAPDSSEPALGAMTEVPPLAEPPEVLEEPSLIPAREEVLGVPLGAPLGEPLAAPLNGDAGDEEFLPESGPYGIEFHQAIPVFRIFDQEKAREYYCDFLGFEVEWEHQSDERSPVYIAIHREGLTIHLTEHHGDCCPGSSVFVWMTELEQFYEELLSKEYPHFEATMEATPYAWFFETIDPFGNRVRFSQPLA